MTVQETFFVAPAWRKGTILTGQLEGHGRLRVGDFLVCDEQAYEVCGIEKFRPVADEAGPSESIGLALGTSVVKDGFDGKHVSFRVRPSSGTPVPI